MSATTTDETTVDGQGLADVAMQGLEGDPGEGFDADPDGQGHLPDTNHAKVKFGGVSWDTLEIPVLGEEITVEVSGTIVESGEKLMADGSKRPTATVKVRHVKRVEGSEPE